MSLDLTIDISTEICRFVLVLAMFCFSYPQKNIYGGSTHIHTHTSKIARTHIYTLTLKHTYTHTHTHTHTDTNTETRKHASITTYTPSQD